MQDTSTPGQQGHSGDLPATADGPCHAGVALPVALVQPDAARARLSTDVSDVTFVCVPVC